MAKKATSTRARTKRPQLSDENIVRVLYLLRLGLMTGLGAMITEVLEGEPNRPRAPHALQ